MQTSFTPSQTPRALKVLLALIFVSSILSHFLGPYLILSIEGIQRLYLWEFGTYLFIHPFPTGIIHLAFNLFLIWTFGASLLERLHTTLFFTLFFGSAITAGLFAWAAMMGFHLSSPLLGSSTALYGMLVSWVILNPDARLLLFFTLPLKGTHLLLGLIGLNFMIDLSRSDWIPLFAYLGAIAYGYIFTVIACRIRSPFPLLHRFENGILSLFERLSHLRKKPISHTKIYDIKSGEPILNDEQFMDAMLSRISLYGEESLAPEERKRMQQISEKKASRRK